MGEMINQFLGRYGEHPVEIGIIGNYICNCQLER